MSRYYSDNFRPSSNRYHPYQNNSNSHSNYRPTYHNNRGQSNYYSNNNNNNNNHNNHNRRSYQDRETFHAKLDDQIAPKDASRTTTTLQEWALTTANIPQFGPRSNETQTIERIELRYGTFDGHSDAPFPRYSNGVEEQSEAKNSSMDGKRLRDVSPPVREGLSAMAYVRDVKRRRKDDLVKGERGIVINLTGEGEAEDKADYAQSSEWSWPGSNSEGEGKSTFSVRP
jgi:hypothetical protein